MGVNGLSVQRYGCEGETSRNCLHHARAAASEPYQPPGFLPTCGDPTPRVAFLSETWVRCAIFLEEIARHKTFSAHFLEEIARHKLFRLISSGNRPPQTFSAHFLRKSAATKLFRLISSGNRWDGLPLISSGNRWDGPHQTHVILTSNSRFRRCTWKGAFLMRSPCSSSPNRLKNTVLVRFFLHLAIRSRSDRFSIVK